MLGGDGWPPDIELKKNKNVGGRNEQTLAGQVDNNVSLEKKNVLW